MESIFFNLCYINPALVVVLDRTGTTLFSSRVQTIRREEIGEEAVVCCGYSFWPFTGNSSGVVAVVVGVDVVAGVRASLLLRSEAKTFVAECEQANKNDHLLEHFINHLFLF